MEEFKKLSSNEWGTPSEGPGTGPLHGIEQPHHMVAGDTGTAAILGENETRVGINEQLAVSLDNVAAAEEKEELADNRAVDNEARANQR